MQTKSVKVLL